MTMQSSANIVHVQKEKERQREMGVNMVVGIESTGKHFRDTEDSLPFWDTCLSTQRSPTRKRLETKVMAEVRPGARTLSLREQ